MCIDCLINKKTEGHRPGYLHPISPETRPFTNIHIDHTGPFETSSKLNKYILVIADNLTKYVHLFPLWSTDTKGVLKNLIKFIQIRGTPDCIITDRGTGFTSKNFADFC